MSAAPDQYRPTTQIPGWVQVGGPVAVVKRESRKNSARVSLAKVASIAGNTIITDLGERFDATTLEASRCHGTAVTTLANPRSRAVAEALRAQKEREQALSIARIERRFVEFLQDPSREGADMLARAARDYPGGGRG